MKSLTLTLLICFSFSSWASLSSCEKYQQVKARLAHAQVEYIDDLIRHNEWQDERYSRQDRRGTTINTLRIMIFGVNWSTFTFMPTRVASATRTGYYSSNPENFMKFLQIETRHACQYLSMTDREAGDLRAITHEAWTKLTPERIRRISQRR
jgi:hypothetical protein